MKLDAFDYAVIIGVILANIGIFATFGWQIGLIIIGATLIIMGFVGAKHDAT